MNKLIKTIGVAAVTLSAVIICNQAHAQPAQVYAPQTLSLPTIIHGVTTNLYVVTNAPLIDVRKAQSLAIRVSGGIATNCTYVFGRSIDGITWETNVLTMFTAGNGKTDNYTNISVGGYGYYRIESEANGDAAVIATNSAVYAVIVGPK